MSNRLFISIVFLFTVIFCIKSTFAKLVDSGVEYAHYTKFEGVHDPISVHVLTVDPHKVNIVSEHAMGGGTDREEVSSMGKRYGALAATNAGFYRRGGRFNGNSLGVLIGDHVYSDLQLPRGAVGWKKDCSKILIGKILLDWNLTIGGKSYPVDRLNQPRGEDEAILYNDAFRESTLTTLGGCEVVIVDNKVADIRKKKGDSNINKGGFVYSIGPSAVVDISEIKKGMSASISYRVIPECEGWNGLDYIVSGACILISGGQQKSLLDFHTELTDGRQIIHSGDEIAADFHSDKEREWFVETRNPRTAIGIKPDGTICLVVVDGRQKEISVGMTLKELASFMFSLGCLDALNLGGGGCSTMLVGDKVINSASGSTGGKDLFCERPVSDAILILPK